MADVNSKRCTSCGQTKQVTEFHKRTASKDGRSPICVTCQSTKHKRYHADNAASILMKVVAWQAANPDRVSARRKRWAAENPEKMRASRKKWKKDHPDEVRADAAMRARANPEKRAALENVRRTRKAGSGGKFTAAQIATLHSKQRGRCACCSTNLKGRFHRDHIMPVALGGSSDITNIQLLCPTCNSRKGAKHPIEHAQELGRLL